MSGVFSAHLMRRVVDAIEAEMRMRLTEDDNEATRETKNSIVMVDRLLWYRLVVKRAEDRPKS